MTVYTTEADLRAYAVGLTLPADVAAAVEQGNHWVTRQVERAGLTLDAGGLVDAKYAASAYALNVLTGNGLITIAEQDVEALKLGPLEFKLGKSSSARTSLPDHLAQAKAHLDDAGLDFANEAQVEIVTNARRRW